ncbi:MAG: hypothetical protein ABJD97_14320 [Betaproteobacteria bacterium]
MDSNNATVTIWQSGRLAPQHVTRRFAFDFEREQWLGAALLVLSAVVLALFVGVLEHAMGRAELAHEAQRSRAVAEAQCEAGQPAAARGSCIALFNGDVAAAEATGDAPGTDARVTAVSMNTLQAAR